MSFGSIPEAQLEGRGERDEEKGRRAKGAKGGGSGGGRGEAERESWGVRGVEQRGRRGEGRRGDRIRGEYKGSMRGGGKYEGRREV
jgi:hypothetical protein